METIVVGVDGSECSLEAFRWAVEEAQRRHWAVKAVLAWGLPYGTFGTVSARGRSGQFSEPGSGTPMEACMTAIALEDVWKVFADGTEAVRALDLDIADGEFMVLVGPSGCGKTTALRMVAGLEAVTKGTIRIGDRVVNDVPPKDRDIAMVFQNYALYPHMTVFENMAFGLKLQKLSRDEISRRVGEAARILGLGDLLNRKPKALSGGQRQRVAMGRAIVRHPHVFLMDEPLSNLDAKLRVQMRSEIARIQNDLGVTTIYVTHDQTACKARPLLDPGRRRGSGGPHERRDL